MMNNKVQMFQNSSIMGRSYSENLYLKAEGVFIKIPGFCSSHFVEETEMNAAVYEEMLKLLRFNSMESFLKQETRRLKFEKGAEGIILVMQTLLNGVRVQHVFSEENLRYMKNNLKKFRTVELFKAGGISLPEDGIAPTRKLSVKFLSGLSVTLFGRAPKTFLQNEHKHNLIVSSMRKDVYFDGHLNVGSVRIGDKVLAEVGQRLNLIKISDVGWENFREKCFDGSYDIEKMIISYICENKS